MTQFPIHTSLATSDLERAKTWYSEKLDLTPDQENGGIWFRFAGDTWLHVNQTSAAGTAQNTVAGITVTTIEEVIEQLRQRGVEFEDYEVTENGLATFETAKVAWFRDPDGNTIELSETLTQPNRQSPVAGLLALLRSLGTRQRSTKTKGKKE